MANLVHLNVQENLDNQNFIYWKNRTIQIVSIVAFAALGIGGAVFAASYGTTYIATAFLVTFNLYTFVNDAFLNQFRDRALRAAKEWKLYRRTMDQMESGQLDVLQAQIAVKRNKTDRACSKADLARQAANAAAEANNQSLQYSKLAFAHKKTDFNYLLNKVRLAYLLWLDAHREAPRAFADFISEERPRTLVAFLVHRHANANDDVFLKRTDGTTFTRRELIQLSVEEIRDRVFNSMP